MVALAAILALLAGAAGPLALAQGAPAPQGAAAPQGGATQSGASPQAATRTAGPAKGAATPRISGVLPDTVFSGGVIEVRGTNFSDAREDVLVTVGGTPAVVLETGFAAVKVMIPASV